MIVGVTRRSLAALLLGILLAALAACGGSDGAPGAAGPAGPPGPPGPPGAASPPPDLGDAESISATITGVTIASPPVVEFQLTDGSGQGLAGLPASAISFTIARLMPGANGDPSSWQSYVQTTESADGADPDVLAEATQATTESGSAGTLVDNGDGTYQYTFALDVTNVAGMPYDPTLTHRVGFEIRGFAPVVNPTYTFRPSDGATTGIYTRDIVETASCNNCHDQLALHGGARMDTKYCVTCHNPGSTDQDTGNTVSFPVLIHKIHRGANLPSVVAGGDYSIYGFRESANDYSDVVFPQDVRNCRTCHDESDPNTPDAKNWMEVPNIAACGACHDDVNFETGENHGPEQLAVSNADCVVCHRPGGLVGGVDESHAIAEQEAAAKFQYNVLGVSAFAPGQTPSVTFSVTDPSNGDAPYDIANDTAFVQGSGNSRVAVNLAWSTTDYSNTGSGSATVDSGTAAQPIVLNPLFGGAVDNGDGSFTVTSPIALPADIVGTGSVAIEGHPALDVNDDGTVERLPVTGVVQYFALTDANPVARRQVVDLAKCQVCHQSLSLHGSNRTDNIYLCVTCHNADATDISRREQAAANAQAAGETFDPPDGKAEEAIHFKTMIHGIHAGATREHPLVIYGFGGSETNFAEVTFPGNLARCDTCHLANTYYPVDDAAVLATTTVTGADRTTPLDDVNTTPNAAACAACHDDELTAAHIEQNGGAFDVAQTAEGTLISASHGTVIETCAVCHGPGRLADVKVVHGF